MCEWDRHEGREGRKISKTSVTEAKHKEKEDIKSNYEWDEKQLGEGKKYE